jgi:hypothetical protein
MKKIFSTKRLLLFSAAIICAYGIILACGGGDIDERDNSNFTPEVFVKDASYAPLFFSYHALYPTEITDPIIAFNENILTDWSTFLAGKLPADRIKHFLLDTGTTKSINEIYDGLKGKNHLLGRYPFVNPAEPKVKGFFEFLHYAKAIETSSTTSTSFSWSYRKKEIQYTKARDVQETEAMYLLAKDPFLKNRFWFQTVKGRFYSDNKESVLAFFERTKSTVPINTLYYRALAYVAGVHHKNQNYSMANYLYSVVFDKCPEVRWILARSFHPQQPDSSFLFVRNDQEKAALWALTGYYGDEKEAIQEIYKLVPTSPHLDFLLTRLINKEENRLSDYSFKNSADYLQAMKAQVSQEAVQLVNRIAAEGKTAKPFLWSTAAGYLNIFAGNFSVAKDRLDQAAKVADEPAETAQVRMLNLINSICNTSVMKGYAVEKLLADLKWLYSKPSETQDLRYENAIRWSRRYISSLYRQQGDDVMAELFWRNNEFYRSETNLEAMKAFMMRTDKSPMEVFVQSSYEISLSDIFEYQGVMRAFAGKIGEAIGLMKKSNEGKTQLPGNPFNGNIKDCHDCEHAAYQTVIYRKLSMLEKMKEMNDLADSGKDIFNNSLLVGNAFYNMSYFGNARAFYYGKIMDQYSIYIDPYYQPYLLNSSLAATYYQRAFEAATTAEQKAKCSYLLAKCERNEFYAKTYHSQPYFGKVPVAYKEWGGFKKLRDEYRNTKYCQEVIRECGYFRDYVSK